MLFLSAQEVKQLAEAIDAQFRVLIYTAAYTGLRAGELAGLQRQDVGLLRGVLHVRRALKDVRGRLEYGPTKTHATRTIALPGFLKAMLEEHLTGPNTTAADAGPSAPVFTMKGGGPLRHGLFFKRYYVPAVRAVLPAAKHRLRFHDLRHTCPVLSIAAGAHPKLIAARRGHSSVTISIDRYGHLFPSMEESLAGALDAAFAAAPAQAPRATSPSYGRAANHRPAPRITRRTGLRLGPDHGSADSVTKLHCRALRPQDIACYRRAQGGVENLSRAFEGLPRPRVVPEYLNDPLTLLRNSA
jgi:Phage integrase family